MSRYRGKLPEVGAEASQRANDGKEKLEKQAQQAIEEAARCS